MTHHLSEIAARERAKDLRKFYTHITIYGLINFASFLIWLMSGMGYFWPIWIIVGWGIGLALEAASLGLVPVLTDVFPFLKPEWEEGEAKRLMNGETSSTHSLQHSEKKNEKTVLVSPASAKPSSSVNKVAALKKKPAVKSASTKSKKP